MLRAFSPKHLPCRGTGFLRCTRDPSALKHLRMTPTIVGQAGQKAGNAITETLKTARPRRKCDLRRCLSTAQSSSPANRPASLKMTGIERDFAGDVPMLFFRQLPKTG